MTDYTRRHLLLGTLSLTDAHKAERRGLGRVDWGDGEIAEWIPTKGKAMAKVKKASEAKRLEEVKAGGRAIGFIMACQVAELVARRIVDIGHDLDIATIAKVMHPLGLRPEFVEEPKPIRPTPKRRAGK